MTRVLAWAVAARKFLAALTGAAGVAASVGLLNGTPQRWVTGAAAVATAFVVYFIQNEQQGLTLTGVVGETLPPPAVVSNVAAATEPAPEAPPAATVTFGYAPTPTA